MAKVELTTKIIKETVCPQEKQYIYIMDSTVPGFALQVTRGGVKSYAVRYQSNGTRHSKVFAPVDKLSLAATRTRAKEILAAYTIGQDPFAKKANGNNMTIKALFDAWQVWAKEHKTSRPTVLVCQKALQKYFDLSRKAAESLTSHDLRQFQTARTKAGLKPSSINHYVTVLRYVYRWGMAQGLISPEYKFPPVKDLSEAEISPKTHHLSQTDIQKLINEAMRTGQTSEHLRWIILFMLNTGIRPASICGLRWSDIIRLDADGGEIRLRASNIKTKKDVNVSVSATAAEILQTLAQRPHGQDDNIFTTKSAASVNRGIKRLMTKAGLPSELSAYSLRHNYATSLYMAGASPTEMQIQMCHATYQTTQKYIHANFEHQKKVANLLSFGNPKTLKTQTA